MDYWSSSFTFILPFMWIPRQVKSERDHRLHLYSSVLFSLWKFSFSTLFVECISTVFVLHLVLLLTLLSLRRLLVSSCLCVLTLPAIMLPRTHTHTRTQGWLPSPIRHRDGSAWHPNGTQGIALGINIHASIMHKHTNMRSYDTVNTLTCAGGIYADTHRCLKMCRRAHWGTLLDHPIWRLEPTQKTKHLQRQRGRETGRVVCVGGAPHKRKGSGRWRGGEKTSDVLRCPSCWFGSSATYLFWSVAPRYPPLTLRLSCSHLIMGLLLAEIATVWQSWAHLDVSDAYFHSGSVVQRRSSSWDSRRTVF